MGWVGEASRFRREPQVGGPTVCCGSAL